MMDHARLAKVLEQADAIVIALTQGKVTATRVLEIGEVEGAAPGLGVCISITKEIYENKLLMREITGALEGLEGVTNVLIEFPRDT